MSEESKVAVDESRALPAGNHLPPKLTVREHIHQQRQECGKALANLDEYHRKAEALNLLDADVNELRMILNSGIWSM